MSQILHGYVDSHLQACWQRLLGEGEEKSEGVRDMAAHQEAEGGGSAGLASGVVHQQV